MFFVNRARMIYGRYRGRRGGESRLSRGVRRNGEGGEIKKTGREIEMWLMWRVCRGSGWRGGGGHCHGWIVQLVMLEWS